MTRFFQSLAALVTLPLAACASFESDPNKIPEPVKGNATTSQPSSPGAVTEESAPASKEAVAAAAAEPAYSGHSGRASEPGARQSRARSPRMRCARLSS
jgi:hypothetical protein